VGNIFFTSDNHFGHANIIKYCNRPFRSVDGMNRQMIINWNNTVGPDDIVYHLGDVGFMSDEALVNILGSLNGHKHLILGNHDKKIKKNQELFQIVFESISESAELLLGGKSYVMYHYPILGWSGKINGARMLHGHCHGTCDYPHNAGKILDVGVDCHGFRPISLSEVEDKFEEK
jgi:calcineurin-like phosphoesterase family protein